MSDPAAALSPKPSLEKATIQHRELITFLRGGNQGTAINNQNKNHAMLLQAAKRNPPNEKCCISCMNKWLGNQRYNGCYYCVLAPLRACFFALLWSDEEYNSVVNDLESSISDESKINLIYQVNIILSKVGVLNPTLMNPTDYQKALEENANKVWARYPTKYASDGIWTKCLKAWKNMQ